MFKSQFLSSRAKPVMHRTSLMTAGVVLMGTGCSNSTGTDAAAG